MIPGLSPLEGNKNDFQARLPPVGLVETNALPWPAATQKSDRHATAESSPGEMLSINALLHVFAPPAGSREVNTCPFESTATHSALDGQASAVIALSRCDRLQSLARVSGALAVKMFPALSIATQKDAVGHLTAISARLSIDCGVDQTNAGNVAAPADRRGGETPSRATAPADVAKPATDAMTPSAAPAAAMANPRRARTLQSNPRTQRAYLSPGRLA